MCSTFLKILLPRSDQMYLSTAWLKAWPQLHHTILQSQQIYCQFLPHLLPSPIPQQFYCQLLLPWQQSDVLPSEVSHHLQCSMVFPQCGAPGIRPIRLPQWQSMRPSNTRGLLYAYWVLMNWKQLLEEYRTIWYRQHHKGIMIMRHNSNGRIY